MSARALDLSIQTGQNKFFLAGQNGLIESNLHQEIVNSLLISEKRPKYILG